MECADRHWELKVHGLRSLFESVPIMEHADRHWERA